jgi:hypothetical protein
MLIIEEEWQCSVLILIKYTTKHKAKLQFAEERGYMPKQLLHGILQIQVSFLTVKLPC